MPKDLILLRYTDANNRRFAALCRPSSGVEVLRSVLGDTSESDEEWFSQPQKSAVVIDTDGAVTITSHEDMANLCLWFAVAGQWLQAHGG